MADQFARPILGVSSCLQGENVRYDGAHKRDSWLNDQLGQFVDYQGFCPEVGIGLGIPRPPIRLVVEDEQTRVKGTKDASLDVTEALQMYAFDTLPKLQGLDGYIFKSKSPSCGVFRVKRYTAKGAPDSKGVGAYAEVILQQMPNLPVEEEGRLNDPVLRENFINRIYVHTRWRMLLTAGVTAKSLTDFHMCHKYMVMAHSQAAYKRLGRMLSNLKGCDMDKVAEDYFTELMVALRRRVSRARHVNALQHIQGYLKRDISTADKQELATSIEDYRRGEVPLVVPVKLLAHYFRCHPDVYIAAQAYLQPYPAALGLRNQI